MWPGPRYGDALGNGLGGGPPAKLEYARHARLAPSQLAAMAAVAREQSESASRMQICL